MNLNYSSTYSTNHNSSIIPPDNLFDNSRDESQIRSLLSIHPLIGLLPFDIGLPTNLAMSLVRELQYEHIKIDQIAQKETFTFPVSHSVSYREERYKRERYALRVTETEGV